MHADERKGSATDFLKATVARFAAQGVTFKRLLTDAGAAYRSNLFNKTCQALGIKHTCETASPRFADVIATYGGFEFRGQVFDVGNGAAGKQALSLCLYGQ